MQKLKALPACLLLLFPIAAEAGELQAGLSWVPLLMSTPALHVNYRPSQSHFQIGYKYEQWTVNLMNNATHVKTTEITHSRQGPVLIYLSDIGADSSLYFGVELLQWKGQERALAPGGTSEIASARDIYFGGGMTGHVGEAAYYNFGFFLSPTAENLTPAMKSTGSSSSGSFDLHLQIGMRF
ncbi:MAG: hypothetical protein PXX77_09055 [Gallionella sp.]|nr:hypothetical protein [Gallionella sp.]